MQNVNRTINSTSTCRWRRTDTRKNYVVQIKHICSRYVDNSWSVIIIFSNIPDSLVKTVQNLISVEKKKFIYIRSIISYFVTPWSALMSYIIVFIHARGGRTCVGIKFPTHWSCSSYIQRDEKQAMPDFSRISAAVVYGPDLAQNETRAGTSPCVLLFLHLQRLHVPAVASKWVSGRLLYVTVNLIFIMTLI
jgi:hypothetical protein